MAEGRDAAAAAPPPAPPPQGALESVRERDEGADDWKGWKEGRDDNLSDRRITIFS